MGGQSAKLKPEQLEVRTSATRSNRSPCCFRQDLLQSTYFDRNELQVWYKGFVKDCPSGVLGKTEFAKIYKQFFPFGDPTKFSSLVFNVFDKDKVSALSFLALITHFSRRMAPSTSRSLYARCRSRRGGTWMRSSLVGCGQEDAITDSVCPIGAFNLYDIDGDGEITRDEMFEIVDAIYCMMVCTARYTLYPVHSAISTSLLGSRTGVDGEVAA